MNAVLKVATICAACVAFPFFLLFAGVYGLSCYVYDIVKRAIATVSTLFAFFIVGVFYYV